MAIVKYLFTKFLIFCFDKKHLFLVFLSIVIALMLVSLGAGKIYQHWDNDDDRGAIAIAEGSFNESYTTPVYLDQGWS